MKPLIALSMLLWTPIGSSLLRAQSPPPAATRSVLILLRQPEGSLGKRLAEVPPATSVPDEVRAAALSEQKVLIQAQQESFDQRLASAGASQVIHYPDLNMLRADIPPPALSILQSDPAVVSVTPLSEETPVVAPPPAGMTAGPLGHRFDAFQPSSLSHPAFLPSQTMQMTPMQMPPMPMPGLPATPGAGGMVQSLLGMTGQLGMQAESAMPHAAGIVMLLSGTAQLAQVILANRKPSCAMTLAGTGAPIPESGGQGVIAVNAPASCLWQAHSDADWLQINTEGPMLGPGIVKYTAAPATAGMLRTGVISMAGVANNKVKGKTSITIHQGK